MRRVALLALVAVVAGAVIPAAGVAASPASPKPKAKVRCHWVKATKKRKRHRVCVKVKAKKKATTTAKAPAPAAPVPPVMLPVPVAPVAPAVDPAPGPAPLPVAELPPPAPAPPVAPARLQVTTREWSLALSRATLVAGPAIVELVNRGEDPHDLHLRPAAGGTDVLAIAETGPGAVESGSATLAAGAYTLYCALPGHEAAGMKAQLTVG